MVEYILNLISEKSGALNVLTYLSSRTISSTLTGLLIVLLFGDKFIQIIKKFQFNQNFDGRAPESHKKRMELPQWEEFLLLEV